MFYVIASSPHWNDSSAELSHVSLTRRGLGYLSPTDYEATIRHHADPQAA